eukprot:Phypoly_transcript_16340.p1 GENE.Phypoly_transcript_16340~~Phypoly_transcript_16340.p1  ORF type:complete len:243 (+),score=36.71 Phypoly_transcript_16340:77-730(+)
MDSLVKMRADAEKYSEHVKLSLAEAKKQHAEYLQYGYETITTLNSKEQDFLTEAQRLQTIKAQERQEIEDLRTQLIELKTKEERLPEVLESYQTQVKMIKYELDAKKREMEEQEKQIRQKLQRATMGIEFYRNRFGLQFEKLSDSGIRVIFTNVDSKDHERKFMFSLSVEEDKYHLLECKPKLSGVQPLVDELNTQNNISRFVVQMRKKFQQKCLDS